jgi:hypothetical protein
MPPRHHPGMPPAPRFFVAPPFATPAIVARALAATVLAGLAASPRLAAMPPATPPAMPAAAQDGALCHAAIGAAEAGTRIPDAFLNAIGRVESGRPSGAGLTPWPWTINAAGTGHFYASKAEAVAAAKAFQAAGIASIDVGCLQVNLFCHPDAFASLDEAFDPTANAAYAARLLQRLFAQQGSWPRAAAAYHSQTPALGQDYQAKVLAAWALPDRPGAAMPADKAPAPHGPTPPFAAMPPPPGAFAGGPVLGFTHSQRLPGAATPSPTGRSLAAYRAYPVRFATIAPQPAHPAPLRARLK